MTRADLFRDALGVPHLRADDELALAEAQGRVTALDRAWQIEVDRWRAEGRLAERLGPAGLEWDRFARRIRLAETAERVYEALDPDDRHWVDAYVRGVNAGLPAGRAAAPEFDVLARRSTFGAAAPDPTPWPAWAPLGVFLVAHVLFSTFPHLLWRQHVATTLGDAAVDLFAPGAPGGAGSNAWAINGSLSAGGAPLLAGDPHRLLELPGVYQQVRLTCPEYDVVGLAFPGVPGVPHFGHTGPAAWGITNAIAHAVDVFAEQLRVVDRSEGDDASPTVEALGPDGWEPVREHHELITVRGASAESVRVGETARGPVVIDGPGGCFSVRLPAHVDADLGIAAFRRLLRARSAADVADAFGWWVDPVNRVLAADRGGAVLSLTAGRTPDRAMAERRLPLTAWETPVAEWRAATPPLPVSAVAVDANERPTRPEIDLGFAYSSPARAQRIAALLGAHQGAFDVPAAAAPHADVRDARAVALVGRLGSLSPAAIGALSPAAAALRSDLLAWDGEMAVDSAPARAVADWRDALVRRLAGHERFAPLHAPHGMGAIFDPWFSVAGRLGDVVEAVLDAPAPGFDAAGELVGALEDAARAAPGAAPTWGDAPTSGDAHRLFPLHVLADVPGLDPADVPGVAAIGLPGAVDTVRCTGSVPGVTAAAFRGSVARWVWDLGDRDRSRWNVPFGASGVPGHPHFDDQLDDWAHARTAPIVTDWARLEREEWR